MTTERNPSGFGHFSETVAVSGPGKWVHLSGAVAFDESGTAVVKGGAGEQSQVIFDEFERQLAAHGASLGDMIKITVYMTDLSEYGEFSAVRTERFPENPPTSAAVAVADLLLGAKIEIDGLAFVADSA